jgi:hypothetical protein
VRLRRCRHPSSRPPSATIARRRAH